MNLPPPEQLFAIMIVIFFGIGLHEYSHAKFADLAGDPTPRYFGRVTLNLFKHFEPVGTLMIILSSMSGYGIGWGRPCPMDERKMRNPRWDLFVAVLAGPVSNLLQATVYGTILRFFVHNNVDMSPFMTMLLLFGVTINLSLCFFNLIPLGPLDGHWLVGTFMPETMRFKWYRFNRTTGSFALIGLIILGQASGFSVVRMVMGPPIRAAFKLITGLDF